jgi:hypothetical protein
LTVLTLPRIRASLVALLVAGACFAGVAAPAAADDGGADGVSIDVVVIGPPAPTPTPRPGTSGGGGGSSSTPTPTPTETSVPSDVVDLGGILSVGGLTGTITPDLGSGGTAALSITVRNTSHFLMDLGLRFWIQNAFGWTVAEMREVDVRDLLPGETRTVQVRLATVGQWTVYTAHVKVTPPDEVDGTTLTPITRDLTLAVAPLLLVLTLGGCGPLFALVRFWILPRLLLARLAS